MGNPGHGYGSFSGITGSYWLAIFRIYDHMPIEKDVISSTGVFDPKYAFGVMKTG